MDLDSLPKKKKKVNLLFSLYLKGKETTSHLLAHWPKCLLKPGRSQKSRDPRKSPTREAGTQVLKPWPVAFRGVH